MNIKSERLIISPLSNGELKELIEQYKSVSAELSAAYSEMLDSCVRHPEDVLWYTAWKICLLRDNTEIGFAGFKGVSNGQVEIGYGIDEEQQACGYATEAVGAMCRWALSMPGINAVEAETDENNAASEKVLLKNGFHKTGVTGEEGPRFILKK